MPEAITATVPSGHVPRRFVIGALVAGLGVAALAAAGYLGVAQGPRAETFRFVRGADLAPGEEDRLTAHLNALAGDPRRLIRIVGHSGTTGAPEVNKRLSDERAGLVRQIAEGLGIGAQRILFSGGIGGAAPLERKRDESERGYQSRLARVTVESFEAP